MIHKPPTISVAIPSAGLRSHSLNKAINSVIEGASHANCFIEILVGFDSPKSIFLNNDILSNSIAPVVIHNMNTGERTKIRNPVYEQVRNLRGNQPKLQYQYLSLRKEGKVKDFLKFYPENKSDFSTYRDQVHLFTNTLYTNYVSCYIKKEKPLLEFSEQFRTHMFNLHQIYMNNFREKKQFITNTVVQKYVNELHPSLLMYCLNYQMRKRNVDTIITENS